MLIRPIHAVLSLLMTGVQPALNGQQGMYTGKAGTVHFKSEAPLEIIEAGSKQLSGAINPETNGVAFSVRINSFQGFNSAVQRQHFMENYMEATRFPVATFTGKIIEKINYIEPGEYDVRVKGILNIHGINVERIIPGSLVVLNDTFLVLVSFSVLLNDHAINVPRLLSQKIAETIYVQIEMPLQKTE